VRHALRETRPRAAPFSPIPPSFWDAAAKAWGHEADRTSGSHQFTYFEADLFISSVVRPNFRVLEIGCGTGSSTFVHAPEVRLLVGTDVSRGMLRRAGRRAKRTPGGTRVRFARVDAGRLPFKDSVFDAVIGRGVALSFVESPAETLREIRRVLRPGGIVAVDAMNAASSGVRAGRSPRKHRLLRRIGGKPVYIEQFDEGDRQVRKVYFLHPKSDLAEAARETHSLTRRPKDLARQVVRTERMNATYFSERTLRRMAGRAGLLEVRIHPLGQLHQLLSTDDSEMKRFVLRNRRLLSKLAVQLGGRVTADGGPHLMLIASRPHRPSVQRR